MGLPIIVILEDDPNRMEQFYKKLEGRAIIHHFEDVDPCEEFLRDNRANENNISMIFLDHDLGGEIFVSSSSHNTGFTMALKIRDIYHGGYPEVIIHSMNPAGAKNINDVLPTGQRIPFSALIRGL